ncbi:hypothetical protein ACE6H2_026900 [Prunus campanulata]
MDYFTSLNLKVDSAFIHAMNTHTDFQRFRNWDAQLKKGKATTQFLLNVYTYRDARFKTYTNKPAELFRFLRNVNVHFEQSCGELTADYMDEIVKGK